MTGKKIKEIIDKIGLTQRSLAELMEVTPQTISAILTAKDVRTSTVERIAAVTNMPISYFFGEEYQNQSAVASGNGSVAVNGNNTVGNVTMGDNSSVLQERITMLERLLNEKERVINLLMKK